MSWKYDIIDLDELKLISLKYYDFAHLDFDSEDLDNLIKILKEIREKIRK